MQYYLSAWTHAEALWRTHDAKLIDEHLLYVHMRNASFRYSTIAAAQAAEHPQARLPPPPPPHPPRLQSTQHRSPAGKKEGRRKPIEGAAARRVRRRGLINKKECIKAGAGGRL